MSGGGSGGGQTTNTVQKADPWAGQQPFLTDVYQQAQGLQGSQPLQYYPGRTYADLAPETQTSLGMQTQRALAGSPLTAAAQNQLTSTLQGDYLSAGNPYMSQMMEQVSQQVRPRIDAQFGQSGRYGSGAHANAASSALANTAGQLGYQNYADERQKQLQAMMFAPQMAQQDYFDTAKLAEVGGVREDLAQQGINEQMQRFQFENMAPWQQLALYQNMIQGNPGSINTSTTTMPRRSLGAGLLGGGVAGGGLGYLAANMFPESLGLTGGQGALLGAGAGGLLGGLL